MPSRSAIVLKLLLIGLLLAPTSFDTPRGLLCLADAVCTPTLTHTNTILTVGSSITWNVLYIPGSSIAVGVASRELYDFDTSLNTATITRNVRAGNAASGAWAGDQASGANARFSAFGGTMKPDGTTVYFPIGNALAQVTLSGLYPVAQFAGDQAATVACTEGDGTAARLYSARAPAIADATGSTVLVPLYSCSFLALVQTNSPHTVTWKVGNGQTVTAAGYGTSATIYKPYAVTSWGDRFYASDNAKSVVVLLPAANWQLVIITTGSTPQATANDIPFDNTYHSAQTFAVQGSFSTWSNCWLQLFQPHTQVGHIVDPEGGNMFLLAGIASPHAKFVSADLNGNVWVSGHAGNAKDLGKHSIAYTGCPAMSPHKCKWGYMTATATATATLPEVPPRTRTTTPPMATPAPMTTGPATTTAVSSSASASSGSAATVAAATTAATTAAVVGTTAAATTAVVGTTAAATTAAATTTAAMSTTAAASSTSSSSGFSGNGASSVTAVALGLMTMVLAMF